MSGDRDLRLRRAIGVLWVIGASRLRAGVLAALEYRPFGFSPRFSRDPNGNGVSKARGRSQKEQRLAIFRVSLTVGGAERRQPIRQRRAAENAVTATLETLNERITGGEARDLPAQLPK